MALELFCENGRHAFLCGVRSHAINLLKFMRSRQLIAVVQGTTAD
jgi:hypothetical protein